MELELKLPPLRFWLRPNHDNLVRELGVFLATLGDADVYASQPWRVRINKHLEGIRSCYQSRGPYGPDINGAWAHLQAAQRELLASLSEEELQVRQGILRVELEKLKRDAPRRHKEAEAAIGGRGIPLSRQLQLAEEIRDGYYQNVYRRIEMTGFFLAVLSWANVILFAVLVGVWRWVTFNAASPNWAAMLAFGVSGAMGASFSGLQSLAKGVNSATPKSIANLWTTFARIVIGGVVAGLFGATAFLSGVIASSLISKGIPPAFAVAFASGFAGDRPIASLASHLGKTGNGKDRAGGTESD